MSTKTVISFEGVSKKFSRNLRKAMFYGFKDLIREFLGFSASDSLRKTEFWALSDVSFELKKGESLGFIGHNGAGKTTSLKLINGLLAPDKGKITVDGKIGALIALGAGFNPILTGRENIKISAAAMGYTREEIDKKIEEIIDFSEVRDFIDSPVQSYSSGMMARLGFSVAIHTTPDILLVDEVLAVGDLNFVIKCFKKIEEFKKTGGSIILVSHNIYSIRAHCQKVLWVEKGQVRMYGNTVEVCDAYEDYVNEKIDHQGDEFQDQTIGITDINYDKEVTNDQMTFSLNIKSDLPRKSLSISVSIFTLSGVNVASTCKDINDIEKGKVYNVLSVIKELHLSRGHYYLNIVISEGHINNQLAAFVNKYKFQVKKETQNLGAGIFIVNAQWDVKSINENES